MTETKTIEGENGTETYELVNETEEDDGSTKRVWKQVQE